jgi:ABC-type amino acid transport system permease subunit
MKRNYDKDYMRSTNEDYRNGYRDGTQSTLNIVMWAMIIAAVVGFLFGGSHG